MGSYFCDLCGFFRDPKKKNPQNTITAIFLCKNLLHCRNYTPKYWFDGESTIDNSVDNTSSGTLVIVDPL